MRLFKKILAFLSLFLGCIGIILPILPTTPFLLLSMYLFNQTSPRFTNWFKKTTLYENYLENFFENNTLKKSTKILILITVTALFIVLICLYQNIIFTIILLTILVIKYIVFILILK